MDIRNIVILTGAGVSAESGLATFRGPDGLWEGHRVEDVCTPEAYRRNPALVHDFYDARRATLGTAHPNAAHAALARRSRMAGRPASDHSKRRRFAERAGSKRLTTCMAS
jgi:NAD-dependent deacetylase